MNPKQNDQYQDQGFPQAGRHDGGKQGGRGGPSGGGDWREQQDQEEFDRGGQRHGQHSDTDQTKG